MGGGGNLSVNVTADNIIYNDSISKISEMLDCFAKIDVTTCLSKIDKYIDEFHLSKENREGYLQLRNFYNNQEKNPFILYTLICYSFSNQIRFNKNGDFNIPFGKGRSFNPKLREKFIMFVNRLSELNIQFYSYDFRNIDLGYLDSGDFVYCDPPYLITTATYNENNKWAEQDEQDLLRILDDLNDRNIKFGLSNVLESKGQQNQILKEWCKKYAIHYLSSNYSNCNYHKKDRNSKNIEVFITNY